MEFNFNPFMILTCIFLVNLGICYVVVRIFNSGKIKISEKGTNKYILTIVIIVVSALVLTFLIAILFNIGINIEEIIKGIKISS